jgi:chromate transporter
MKNEVVFMSVNLELFLTFFRIGALTFGGGTAILPVIQYEVVEQKKWAEAETVANYVAVGQSLPGLMAVNVSTFVGNGRNGVPGAICATLGMVLPSLIVITAIAAFLQNVLEFTVVQHAFAGVRSAVAALVIQAVIILWKSSVRNVTALVIFAAAFVLVGLLGISPMYIVIGAIVVGLILGRQGRALS